MTIQDILNMVTSNGVAVVFVILMWYERQTTLKEAAKEIKELRDNMTKSFQTLQHELTEKMQQTLEAVTANQEEIQATLEILKDRSER